MTVTVTQSPAKLKASRAALQKKLRRVGITHDAIAALAKCDRTLVVHYFAGRRSASAVVAAIFQLLEQRNGVAS